MPVNASPSIPTESSKAVPAGKFSDWFKNIGDWLVSLSPLGASQYDTDQLPGTINTPWSGTCTARRIGKIVEVKFDVLGGSVANGAYHVFATLPSGIPGPTVSPGAGRGAGLSNNLSVHCYVLTNGSIGFVNDTGGTRTSIAGSVFYTVG